jgi:hypothetical protein
LIHNEFPNTRSRIPGNPDIWLDFRVDDQVRWRFWKADALTAFPLELTFAADTLGFNQLE